MPKHNYDDDYDEGYDDDYEETLEYVRKVKAQLKGVKLTDAQIVRKLEDTNYDIKKTVAHFKPKEVKPVPPAGKSGVAVVTGGMVIKAANVAGVKAAQQQGIDVSRKVDVAPTTVFQGSVLAPSVKGEMNLSDDDEVAVAIADLSIAQPATQQTHQALTMVVTGHVDAGKSTLVGHLLYKVGQVAQRTMHKYEKDSKAIGKASFSLAWVTDESRTEREHGVTIDVAERTLLTDHRLVTILDTPGHKDFIPNMIKGASQADVALLVVPAVVGEFESSMKDNAQTREHATLLKALGVSQIIVVVNKMDSISPDPWSHARFLTIEAAMRNMLCSEMRFAEKLVRFIPLSGLTGENIVSLNEVCPLRQWYSGPTLLQAIDSFAVPVRAWQKPLRAVVHEVVASDAKICELEISVLQGKLCGNRTVGFYDNTSAIASPSTAVSGPVSSAVERGGAVSGLKEGGVNATGTPATSGELHALRRPTVSLCTILSSSSSIAGDSAGTGTDVSLNNVCLFAGERGRIQLTNKYMKGDELSIRSGAVLFKGPSIPSMCREFKASISTMANMSQPIIPGTCFELYLYGAELQCRITKLHSMLIASPVPGADDSIIKKPKCLSGAVQAMVTIHLESAVLMEPVKGCRPLARFALRARGSTVAVGVCEKILQ